jgi:hypothetical protein
MPKKKETIETPDESILVTAAKAIGTAAGKVARLAGATGDISAPAKSQKTPKLSKKSNQKLPRRQKKAAQKKSK